MANFWMSMLTAGGDAVEHELWCAVIRTIATEVLKSRGWKPWMAEDDDDSEPDILVREWLRGSLPLCTVLGDMLGEFDYFRDMDSEWGETVSLSGEACPCIRDIVSDLREKLFYSPHGASAVTAEVVEDFYQDWRSEFLRRVLREAEELKTKNDQ